MLAHTTDSTDNKVCNTDTNKCSEQDTFYKAFCKTVKDPGRLTRTTTK